MNAFLTSKHGRFISHALLLWALLAMITTPLGAGVTQAALLISVVGLSVYLWRNRAYAFADTTTVVRWLLIAALIQLSLSVFHGLTARALHLPVLIAVSALSVGLWRTSRPNPAVFWQGLCAAAIAAGLFALYQRYALGIPRAHGWHNPILFGDIAMGMGLMCLAGLVAKLHGQAQTARSALSLLPYVLGILFGVIASILSGSRGGWLAFVLCFIPLYSYTKSWRLIGAGVLIAGAVVVGLVLTPKTHLLERAQQVVSDLKAYKAGNAATSLGVRIELNRASLLIAKDNPVAGVGSKEFRPQVQALIDSKVLLPIPLEAFNDTHNELTDALFKGGLIGVLSILILYIAPLAYFYRAMRRGNVHSRAIALAGALFMFSAIDFGLTVNLLTVQIGKAYYCIMLSVLIGLCSSLHGQAEPTASPR